METKKGSSKRAVKRTTKEQKVVKHIGLVKKDPFLEPYENAIRGRMTMRCGNCHN